MKRNIKKVILLIVTIVAVNFLASSLFAQDIQVDDGGIFTMTTGTYSNTISSTTANNASTAIVRAGNAGSSLVTLTGDHTAYYGLFTMTNGSTLNYASVSPDPITVPAKVSTGDNTSTTTFVKKNGDFTLSGDQSNITFQLGSYGVLDLTDAANTGDLTLAKDLYFVSNIDVNSYIKYKLSATTPKIISSAGKIYTNEPDGSIDVSKKFRFDMTDVTSGTAGEIRNFTIATCQTEPFVSGTPTASNAGYWTDFTITVTGTGPYNIVFSATYLPPVIDVIATGGTTSGSYSSLKDAFDMINSGIHTGIIQVEVFGTTTETASCVLNASGTGSADYASVSLYPTFTGLRIVGNIAEPLIDLNGADNVTIDGRVNATGSTNDLVVENTSLSGTAGTSTIRFINDALTNIVEYCTLKGSSTDVTGGILSFSTTTGSTGNDGNIVRNNNITNSNANRTTNAIYSLGTVAKENSGNTISDNNIYDFLHRGVASNGIYLSSNTTAWTISGNSFYETASFVPTGSNAYNIIAVDNSSGTGFTVSNNYIGGSLGACAGSWVKTNAFNNTFTAIYMGAGTAVTSNIQGNTIKNISWSNSSSANWYGIYIGSGNVNVGATAGNIIGSNTGTGSLTLTALGASSYGIYNQGAGTINIQGNIIGSVTTVGSATESHSFYGIYQSPSAASLTVNNNAIGSPTEVNSIYASSASTTGSQLVYGIYSEGIGTASMTFNTIANLNNGTTNISNGRISGITTTAGVNTISDNLIHDLKVASNASYSIFGIYQSGTDGGQNISENTIYNLSNTYSAYTGNIYGIYFLGGNSGTNSVSNNFIHSLSPTGTNTTAGICGISAEGGSATYSNNIVSLGTAITTGYRFYGIYENGASGSVNNLYHNTIYIGGSVDGVTSSNSYCLMSNSSENTRNFRSNIFYNARTNSPIMAPTTGTHYAAFFNYAVNTGLTLDYNDYRVTGSGGKIGRYNSLDVTTLPIVAGNDAHSSTANPNIISVGSATATDYRLIADLDGVNTGITTDYGEVARANYTMGAWEFIPVAPTTQASLVTFTSVSYTTMTVGWTNGNGSRRAVFMKEGTGVITNPTDLTTYTASADWSSKGTQLGTSGYYCIYNGNSNTVDLTGLNHGVTYVVQVFEYNGPSLGEKFITSTATDNPKSQATDTAYFSDGTNFYGTWSGVASGISAGGTATMLDNYIQSSSVVIFNDFALDLNGHSFSGAQTSTIADSKTLGLKGSTGSFDGVISFAGTNSTLRILSQLTFGTSFITSGSAGLVIIGDGTATVSFECNNGDALFTSVSRVNVKNQADLSLGDGLTYTPDILIEDGGIVKLTTDAATYPNIFTTSTANSTSTAILQIGGSTLITATVTGDMEGYYGRVTMVNGSALVVNMSSPGPSSINSARFEVGGASNTSTTTLSFIAGIVLNNGDITNATNSITIDKYGVLDFRGLTGALSISYGDVVINNPTEINHGIIQFGVDFTTRLLRGSFDIGTSIDVSSHFVFDMNNHVGTFGQPESFTFASTFTEPVLTGTPAPSNADHWSDFSVTATPPPTMLINGWLLKLNALYYQPIIYVDASKTDDTGDGLSWSNAKQTLQAALDLSLSGYQIWVKEGTYKPTLEARGIGNRYKTFQMKDGVAIYGSFDGTEASINERSINSHMTILSGDLDGNDVYSGTGSTLSISNNSENCYSVIWNDLNAAGSTATAILDGFVIKGGNADGETNATYGGGGMHNNATYPTIRNCRFEYNSAIHGAAFFSYSSTSAFYNCVFVNNYGYSTGYGGTIYNNAGNGLAFNNCDIVNNYSANVGGVVSYNTSTILNNSVVWGNYSVNNGHQIYCTANGNITLNYSCYQNEAGDVFTESGSTFTATNNDITTDPKFVDATNGDFSIAGTSSCPDLGNDSYNSLTTDIRGAGFGRKLLKTDALTTGTIDIGAYEYKFGTDPATLCTNPDLGGEIGSPQTICYNTLPVTFTNTSLPTGQTGDLVYQWQITTVSPTTTFTDWTNVGTSSPTYTHLTGITTNSWFRRLALVGCATPTWETAVSSNEIEVSVDPLPEASTSGSATICENSSYTLQAGEATSANGMILWAENGFGTITAGGTGLTPTYTAATGDAGGTVTMTMTVTSDNTCGTATATATYAISVDPLPEASTSGSATICENSSYTLQAGEATSANGTILWTENGFGTITAGGTGLTPTYTAAAGDAGGTVTMTMTVTSDNTCGTATATATYAISVDPLPEASTSGSATICENSSYTLQAGEATSANGTILWTENGSGTITAGGTGLTPTYTAAAGDAGGIVTMTMTVTSDNTCGTATATATYTINIDPLTVVGTIGGTSITIVHTSTGDMSLTGQTGDVLQWEKKMDDGDWQVIPGTATTTFSETPVTVGEWSYRALVQSGVCASDYTDPHIIDVIPAEPDYFILTAPAGPTYTGSPSGNFVIALFDEYDNPTFCRANTTFNLSTNSTSSSHSFNPASPLVMPINTYSSTFTYTETRVGTFNITASYVSGSVGLTGEALTVPITVILPEPWLYTNIGASNGTTEFFPEINAGTFQQSAQGLSAPKSDVMNFVYQQLCGTGTVIARLSDVVNGGWAGVMMRESNAPGSKAVLFKTKLYNPNTIIGYRSATNGNMVNVNQSVPSIHWMKIQRTGNTFKIFTSYNGTTWTRRQTVTIAMSNCINAGIFAENAVSGRTTTSWFDHAEVVGYLKETDEENVEITDPNPFEVMVYPNPANDFVMITVPENDETVKVTLISAAGIVVETSEFKSIDVTYYLNHIKPGMYLLRFDRNGTIVNKRLVVL
jgi:hypothetical protein